MKQILLKVTAVLGGVLIALPVIALMLAFVILPFALVIWGIINLVTAGVSVWNVGAIVVGSFLLLVRLFRASNG